LDKLYIDRTLEEWRIEGENSILGKDNSIRKKSFTKQSEIDYSFNFTTEEVKMKFKNENFKHSLTFIKQTFDEYLRDVEHHLNKKYHSKSKEFEAAYYRLDNIRSDMLKKLITSTFEINDVIDSNNFARKMDYSLVPKNISQIFRFTIPDNCIKKFKKKESLNIDDPNEKSGNYYNSYDDTQKLISRTEGSEIDKILTRLEESWLGFVSFGKEEGPQEDISKYYKNALISIFKDMENYNLRLYKVFQKALNGLQLDFHTFILAFCILIHFAEDLYTKINFVKNEIHIEVFGDDEYYLNKSKECEYSFQLSENGLNYLIDYSKGIKKNNKKAEDEKNKEIKEKEIKEKEICNLFKTFYHEYDNTLSQFYNT
jgi:hypothetical protein